MTAARCFFFTFFAALLSAGIAAEPKAASFVGKYEAAMRGKSAFELGVEKAADGFAISFSAGNEDGSGAAPDGDGTGKLNARGELEFTFEDSFGNKGRGVLRRAGKGFVATLELTTAGDGRAEVHYGERRLKRVATPASGKTRE